jgi:seryl-tRNA synthetase
MHDIRAIREAPEPYVKGWDAKGLSGAELVAEILELDRIVRASKQKFESHQARRNELSKLIGQAKAQKYEEQASILLKEVEALKLEETIEPEAAGQLQSILASLPNIPAPDVPVGPDEDANVEVRRWGTPFAISKPKDHVDLGGDLGLLDFEAAVRMSGSRFVVLKGQLARLERALGQFMLDFQTTEHGYTEVSPPLLVNDAAAYGTDKLPKFADDLFQTTDGRWLIPTAEVPLTSLVMDQITPQEDLPLRYTALTPCFRSEAGASGRDTRGMIRQHQFYKVELVSIVEPDKSDEEHERMVGCAEAILKRLELPFRTMLLCTGDMGFGARKTYDLEVWLPSEGRYREISSCSNCGDFQARRMDARTKAAGEKGTRFVHTLNGSGLAVGRTLVALMENYQDEDGRIAIPQALHPYLPGLTHIGGKAA